MQILWDRNCFWQIKAKLQKQNSKISKADEHVIVKIKNKISHEYKKYYYYIKGRWEEETNPLPLLYKGLISLCYLLS